MSYSKQVLESGFEYGAEVGETEQNDPSLSEVVIPQDKKLKADQA